MATKRKRRKSSTSSSPKRRKRTTSRKKGLGGLPASGGTTTQKVLAGSLLVLSGVAGAVAGAAVGNKFNLPAGIAMTVGAMAFAPEKYKHALASAGIGMAVATGKLEPGKVPAAAVGVSGIEGFKDDAISRVKNLLSEFGQKAYVEEPVNKMLGFSGFGAFGDVNYNPDTANDEYARMLQANYNNSSAPSMGNLSPLLAGIGKVSNSIGY